MKAQIGLPVQLFGNSSKGMEILPAIIVDVRDYPHAEIDLLAFTKTNNPTSVFVSSVRHKDFKKDGENYWDFLDLDE